jgi:OOP family OmpA-OmpF porin
MNTRITKSTMLIALLGLSSQLFAQETPTTTSTTTGTRFGEKSFRTWSVGVHGGILSPNTIFGSGSVRAREFKSIGYGVNVRKQLLPSLGLQADFLRGDIKSTNGTTDFQQSVEWVWCINCCF